MKNQLSILEVNTERTWRGGERQTWYDILAHSRLGHRVWLICLRGSLLHQKAVELPVIIIPVESQKDILKHLIKNGSRYDVVHVQTAKALTYVVLAGLLKPFRIVATRRVDFVPSGILTRWKYNRCDAVVAISTAIENILREFGVRNLHRISEIAEAKKPDHERALQWLDEHGISGKKIIATTSALVPHKDPINMVRAMARLREKRKDFVFIHFGDGELRSQTENEIEKLGLGDSYLLPGFISQPEDFFSVFDVFVMSSCEEGLGSSVLDAFIYGVPVVSTTAGGLAETVGERGWLTPPRDPEALAGAVEKALSGSAEVGLKVEMAKIHVTQHHSVEVIGKKYEALFLNLAGRG